MKKNLMNSGDLKKYFANKNYNCISPYNVVNNSDTVFLSAGIQPILSDFCAFKIKDAKKIYLSQPVIRTQFLNSVSEGSSIAFINSTTAGFNISESNHNELVNDWIELFYKLGMNPKNIESRCKDYERNWGELLVSGKKNFYYYNNVELGDATFFTKITNHGQNIGIDSMSDVGFGLERVRWCLDKDSYFNLYSDSREIKAEIKAYLSVIALLAVNEVRPSNKNSGYRARLFSKKLVNLLNGLELKDDLKKYLCECIKYWKDWQEINKEIDINSIENEYIRNCNRYNIDKLTAEGYKNLSKIDINVSREEFEKRLLSSGVEKKKVKKLIR